MSLASWIEGLEHEFVTSPFIVSLEAGLKAAVKELSKLAVGDIEVVAETIGLAALEGGAEGGVAGALAAGIAAAPAALKVAENSISQQTVTTVVGHIVSTLQAQGQINEPGASGAAPIAVATPAVSVEVPASA